MKLSNFAFVAALSLAPVALFAQAAAPAVQASHVTGKTIQERKTDQQERIAQGVRSGQLTAAETSRLEHQEAGISKEERGMRAQDNGHLTAADKKLLTRQQNQESRRIARDKHNRKTR